MECIRRRSAHITCLPVDRLTVGRPGDPRYRACLAKALIVAGLLAAWTAPSANASGIYWSVTGSKTIGHADLDGTGVDQSLISTVGSPAALAVDDTYLYFAQTGMIGRAKLDGTAVEQSFIPVISGTGGIGSRRNVHLLVGPQPAQNRSCESRRHGGERGIRHFALRAADRHRGRWDASLLGEWSRILMDQPREPRRHGRERVFPIDRAQPIRPRALRGVHVLVDSSHGGAPR